MTSPIWKLVTKFCPLSTFKMVHPANFSSLSKMLWRIEWMFTVAHAQHPFHQVCCNLGYCVAQNGIMKHIVDVRNGNRSMPQEADWSDKIKLKSQVETLQITNGSCLVQDKPKKTGGKKRSSSRGSNKTCEQQTRQKNNLNCSKIRRLLRGRCYRKKWTCSLIYFYSGVDFPDESVSACWSTNKRRHRVSPECFTKILLI